MSERLTDEQRLIHVEVTLKVMMLMGYGTTDLKEAVHRWEEKQRRLIELGLEAKELRAEGEKRLELWKAEREKAEQAMIFCMEKLNKLQEMGVQDTEKSK